MAMVCPQCNSGHEQRLQCPTCGTRLVFQEVWGQRHRSAQPSQHWLQSFGGRLLIGLVLAQGLSLGFRHLSKGILLASKGEEALQPAVQTFESLLLNDALQLVPLLLGTLVAAASQRNGFILGLVVGLCNSILCMLGQMLLTKQPTALSWLGQPLLQAGLGCLGGWMGSVIWPAPVTQLPADRQLRKLGGNKKRASVLAGKVAWFRVILGTLLAVAGSLWAEYLLQTALKASAGALDTATRLQDEIFTWEVKALVVLFGGALAGASTANGFKQGLCVALFTCLVLLALPRSHTTGMVAFLTVFSTFTLSAAGGWFGGQLLPPVVSAKNSHKLGPSY